MVPKFAISRLKLSNFRSHRHLEHGFDQRPVVIHGPNGSGKTNLLEAVSMLAPGRGLRRAVTDDMARVPEKTGWKITAEIQSPDGPREIETWSVGAGRSVRLDGKATSQVALGHVVRMLWLTPAMDRLWTESAAARRRFLDRMTLSLIPGHSELALGFDRALRGRNRLLKDEIRDPSWYDAVETQMATLGAELVTNRRVVLDRLASAPDTGEFPKTDFELRREGPADQDGLFEALREGRRRDQAAGRTLIGPHRDDLVARYASKGMEARLCSTGEQKALLISTILANAHAVAEDFGAPPLLLLDEVTAHLDTDRRMMLFNAMDALGAQSWLTGTGAEQFQGLGDRVQWLSVSEQDGDSRVRAGGGSEP